MTSLGIAIFDLTVSEASLTLNGNCLPSGHVWWRVFPTPRRISYSTYSAPNNTDSTGKLTPGPGVGATEASRLGLKNHSLVLKDHCSKAGARIS